MGWGAPRTGDQVLGGQEEVRDRCHIRFFTIPFAVVLTGEIEFPSINSSIRSNSIKEVVSG
jgi:hypothetical protein